MATVTAEQVREWLRLAEAAQGRTILPKAYRVEEGYAIAAVAGQANDWDRAISRAIGFASEIGDLAAAVPALCGALTAARAERDAALAHWRNWSAIRQDLADTNARMWREAETARQTEGQQAAAEIAKLTAERDALAAELASYQRGAAAIAQAVDEYGRYVP